MPSEAFQLVVERYTRDIWRFCASQVGAERADECYQETMLAALEGYPRLRQQHAARTWLLRIAARKAIDIHRASARAPLPQAEVDRGASDPPATSDGSPLELLAALPEKQRAAVAYRFVADLRYREIGTLMGTSEQAARRNVHEGLKTLRTRLGDGAALVSARGSKGSNR
jgi:DNA-directed RNA polymerase specialized sigma24 family protein